MSPYSHNPTGTPLDAVVVGEGSGATQFLFANPDITIPIPTDGSLQIFAGYDEGPPKQRLSDAEAF